jgi:hypothetical protein
MTPDAFRKLALAVDDAVEGGHMDHPDFRIGGRIFATLGYRNAGHAMVKLSPEEQAVVIAAHSDVFAPASGAWGRAGSTIVNLAPAKSASVARAVELAADLARALGPTKSRPKKKKA